MSSTTAGGGVQESPSKFLESLQADLKVLASETKKKYPQIKEVTFVIYQSKVKSWNLKC